MKIEKPGVVRKENVFKYNSPLGLMTRMAITARPENMVPLACPHCKGRFYVADGTNSPPNYGLNDMMSLLRRFDILVLSLNLPRIKLIYK